MTSQNNQLIHTLFTHTLPPIFIHSTAFVTASSTVLGVNPSSITINTIVSSQRRLLATNGITINYYLNTNSYFSPLFQLQLTSNAFALSLATTLAFTLSRGKTSTGFTSHTLSSCSYHPSSTYLNTHSFDPYIFARSVSTHHFDSPQHIPLSIYSIFSCHAKVSWLVLSLLWSQSLLPNEQIR